MITNIQFLQQFSLCWRFFCSKPETSSFFNFTLCIHNENHDLVSFCSSVLWDVFVLLSVALVSFKELIIRLCFQVCVFISVFEWACFRIIKCFNWIESCFILSSAGFWVLLQMKAVSMWEELWVKTRYSWESWIWVNVISETHEWIRSLLYCRINTVSSTHWSEYWSFIYNVSLLLIVMLL